MGAMKARALVLSWFVGWASTTHAHPGHGSTDAASPTHYLIEPAHAGWAILAAALVLAAAGSARRWLRRH